MKLEQESVIDYRALRARKAWLGLRNEDLTEQTGASSETLSRVLSGREDVTLGSVIKIAAALKLRPRVTFEPIPSEQIENGEAGKDKSWEGI